MHGDIRVSARHTGYSRNLAATCDGRSTAAVEAASNAFPLRDYFNLAAVAEAEARREGGRRRMRVRGDNGCDKLVHVRRAKEPLERGGGLAHSVSKGPCRNL